MAAPAAAVEFEPSVQIWSSKGKTTWNHNAQPASPILGNPTSQLTYSDMKSFIIEFALTVQAREFFGTARVGAGSIEGGILRDEDSTTGWWTAGGTSCGRSAVRWPGSSVSASTTN